MGTAESVYSPELGFVWAVAPFAYIVCFLLGKIWVEHSHSCLKSICQH